MADAKRDANYVPVGQFLSNADGTTPLSPYVDSSTNRLLVSATVDIGQVEDDAHTTGDTGVMIFGVRQDTQSDFGADGDYVPLSIDADGGVRVSGGGGGTQYAVDDALGSTPTGTLAIAIRDDALATLTPVEGDAVGLRVGSTGALWTIDVNSAALLAAAQAIETAVEGTLTVGSHAVTNAGTFVVQVNGDALTALQNIDGDLTTIIGHVDGIEALLGTIDTDTGNIATAVQLIDNAIFVDDAAFTPATSSVMVIGAQADETAADSVDEGDAGAVRMDLARNLRVTEACLRGPGVPVVDSYGQVAINLAAGADQVLVSSAANKQIWVYGYHFMVNVAGTVSFQDQDNVALSGIMPFGITGGATVHPSGNFAMPIWKLGTDKDLEVDVVTAELDGWLAYAIVSV